MPESDLKATLHTSMGDINVLLFPDQAPKTVKNFVGLAEGTQEWTDPQARTKTTKPLYDGTIFHRVIADLLVQGGAYTPDMQLKPERAPIANEANNGLSNLRGTISAARRASEKDSAAAQFFINTVDNRQLDYRADTSPAATGFCVFGRVLEGMDVLDKIRAVPVAEKKPFPADVPVTAVLIERASVVED